jgi:hypothetical protein
MTVNINCAAEYILNGKGSGKSRKIHVFVAM